MAIKPDAFNHLIGKPMSEVIAGIKKVHEQHGEPRGAAMNSVETMSTIRDLHVGNLIIPEGRPLIIRGPNRTWNKRRRTILDDLGIDMSGRG